MINNNQIDKIKMRKNIIILLTIKLHHISRAEIRNCSPFPVETLLPIILLIMSLLLDLINGGEISGPIVIKGRYIAGVGAEYTDASGFAAD